MPVFAEKGPKKRIGVARDEAFHFYYRANMEWLKRSGAEIIPFSPLNDSRLPPNLDGVVIGGAPNLKPGRLLGCIFLTSLRLQSRSLAAGGAAENRVRGGD